MKANQLSRETASEVERLRAALAFYGDRRNHRGVGVSAVYNDAGRRAREALGECSVCGGNGWVLTGRWEYTQDGKNRETVDCAACHRSGVEGAGWTPGRLEAARA